MLSWIYWDPDPVAFRLPFMGHPIVWYGILFALGFFVGYYLLHFLFRRFLCFYPEFTPSDIRDWKAVKKKFGDEAILKTLNDALDERISQEPPPSLLLNFAEKFLSAQGLRRLKNRLHLEKILGYAGVSLQAKSKAFSERLTLYIVLGAVIGARLGHIVFYEDLSYYLSHPFEILKTWEGGLASHGGIIGMLISVVLFCVKSRKEYPMVSPLRVIDLLVVPSLFAGVFIRFGNFINQEIIGTVTKSPWAVIFGHPAGGAPPLPRHPAQLYEALFYCLSFALFFRLFPKLLFPKGRLAGLFFLAIFSFRFLVEFVKEEQSRHLVDHILTMGQYLSLPFILLGVFFLYRKRLFLKRSERKHLQ